MSNNVTNKELKKLGFKQINPIKNINDVWVCKTSNVFAIYLLLDRNRLAICFDYSFLKGYCIRSYNTFAWNITDVKKLKSLIELLNN